MMPKCKKKIFNEGMAGIHKVPSEMKPYYKIRSQITEGTNGLIHMGQRIIIPKSFRNKVLSAIHTGHFGIKKCIEKVKFCIYWPGITNQIENFVGKCEMCNKYANSNKKETLRTHEIPRQPWQKLGMDLFELNSQTYLILVDYYSKFPEICNLNKNLTSNIIKNLKSIFARHGTSKILITDSGTQFNSSEIEKLANNWNFSIIPAAPKHQQCNGMVERTIQTIKRLMKKTLEKDEDLDLALLAYRNTPVVNSYTPSQLLMSRYLRDNLPIIDKNLEPNLINTKLFETKK
jgi:hypothetical protein